MSWFAGLLVSGLVWIGIADQIYAQEKVDTQRIYLLEYQDSEKYSDTSFRVDVIDGAVLEVSFDGVVIQRVPNQKVGDRSAGQISQELIPWYGIIDGSDFDAVDQELASWQVPDEYAEYALDAALGFARRSRGDLAGAAHLYRGLADKLTGSNSAMALEVFTGLYEEAVLRSDFVDSSAALSMYGSSDGFDRWYRNRTWVDERYGIDTRTPPIPGLSGEHFLLDPNDTQSLEKESALKLVHQAFIAVEAEGDWAGIDEWSEKLGGVRDGSPSVRLSVELYSMMVEAQKHPDPQRRASARKWLGARSGIRRGTWLDAWCRLGVGVSLMNEAKSRLNVGEDDEASELCSRGVIEFVHVMLRFQISHPMLTELALHHAVEGLSALGRFEEASGILESFDEYGLDRFRPNTGG